MTDVLDRFSPATQAWFRSSFVAPTPAQAGAWEAVSTGQHTLVVAPTGSGKTLAAFLWALDQVATAGPPEDPLRRCRVLYVSPMKALAVDVERNLRSPLVGIGHAADRLGVPRPDVTVAVRSGDTPAADRRAFQKRPSDVLITTPESLFLMLTSASREALRGVETVILDEVHAVAGTKRGAHLALSLERLDALLERPATRIGLSATVRPVEEVARFLAGGRPVTTVQPTSTKEWDLQVVVPVPDLGDLAAGSVDLDGPGGADPQRAASVWPHVEERIVDLVAAQRSTLVFANSRRLAERLTARLNEEWEERLADAEPADGPPGAEAPPGPAADGLLPPSRLTHGTPAHLMGQAGQSQGAAPVLARAHHGSVSKEHRKEIEEALKSGSLPAVVATSSLELGIDMGAVDLVVQVESPPSVASGLQRVGRAGHQVGAVSRGVFFPKHRGDLVQTAVVIDRMRSGGIESLRIPANPVDVLAQQVVAMCALDDWTVDELERLVRGAAPYASLPRSVLEATLDMLSGRYPSDEFAELRPRIVWDRVTDVLSGRPGAQRLAVTSGGTIPDRGLYAVMLATGDGPGRRVGELDEEMVYESRVGDVFTLGSTSWRIEDITHDRVLVTPAPGQPGRLPFWKGDQPGRPAELGAALGAYVRELLRVDDETGRDRLAASGLDDWAADNLLGYLGEQREATGDVPDDQTIVIERFRDEIGDWRVAIHSPYGQQVHAPWALAIAARFRERFGYDVQAMNADDGIILRLPDMDPLDGGTDGHDWSREITDLVLLDPADVRDLVTTEIGGSAVFAARFRECAARALLLPRRNPGRRQALWQQRQRSSQLLEVATRYPSFPIVLEAVRECLQDVFDVPGLVDLMTQVRSRQVRVVDVQTPSPSPFARSLLFGYVAQYLYEGDSPLAERRAAALSLDAGLLSDLLGTDAGVALRDLLDPEVITATEQDLQRLSPDRRCRDAEAVADLLRVLGPLTPEEVALRCVAAGDAYPDQAQASRWLAELEAARRVIPVRIAEQDRWAVVEDAGRLRDALGVAIPPGVAGSLLDSGDDPLGGLVLRHARTHGPFPAAAVASRLGLGIAVVTHALARLVASGQLVEGELLPEQLGGGRHGQEYAEAGVLRLLRRRSLAALRAEVEPVPAVDLARFVPAWHGIGDRSRGLDAVVRAVEQLAGTRLPASALETLVLPARVPDYAPSMLDGLMASGEVLWQGQGSLPGDDGWVSLHLADAAPLTLAPPSAGSDLSEAQRQLLELLRTGGAHFVAGLATALERTPGRELVDDLWALVWAGHVTGDTLAPLRGLLGGGRTTHRSRSAGPRAPRFGRRGALGSLRGGRPGLTGAAATPTLPVDARGVGRWSILPSVETDATVRAWAQAELLLERHGVVTRGSVAAEDVTGGFAAVYRVLGAAEEAGRVRRGYFVEGLGGSQFATTGAVDRLRASSRPLDEPELPASPLAHLGDAWSVTAHRAGAARQWAGAPGVGGHLDDRTLVLAASDPANAYGAALPWPDRPDDTGGHRPGRKAGALVVLVDGRLVLYVERGGKTLLSYSDDPSDLGAAARALAAAVHRGALGRLSVEKADGGALLGSDHPLVHALGDAGFHHTPRGLRLRR
ncbi:ATP-dependent helicase [Arsenicicoccus sp. oral taxon 190]|uniref:ATP-dependent helicase n=1 Tax=Arsenicicoccus sp. oral taxon 190 TaxID=1658671 RepID=UPI000679F1A0|nr:ATP-dependent helicase [Arsenicicoccus sp. oral taxon 190]AKT52200.1 DEAD/DEAH box helicase [Arsenicicoccus sp. oral taxon 190]